MPDAPIALRHAPDRELVQTLSTLMREAERKTGREGKIVLSSTWRLKPETTEAVEARLKDVDLKIDGVTPDYGPEATTSLVDANLSSFTEGATTLVPTAAEGGGLDQGRRDLLLLKTEKGRPVLARAGRSQLTVAPILGYEGSTSYGLGMMRD